MNDSQIPVLEFDNASMQEQPGKYHRVDEVTFAIHRGDVIIVRLQRGREELPLGAAAMGLIEPTKGAVRFQGMDWQSMQYEKQVDQRAHIGRVFDHDGWISNLTLEENVLLIGQQHTALSDRALRKSAVTWARRFGIKDIPRTKLAFVTPWKQRVFQWVRAMMIDPELLVLERPSNDVPVEQKTLLLNAVVEFCERGGAALWLTDDDDLWESKLPPNTSRFKIDRERVLPVGGGVL